MLAGSERQQWFFDAAWCAGLLAENSIYSLLLARHGDRIVRDQDFAECYSARWGRPSIAPSLLAKVLLLSYRDGLSDRRAMEAVRFDRVGRWRWICRSITRGFTRRVLSSSAPGCCCTARSGLCRALARARDRARPLGRVGRADRRLDPDARRGRDPGQGDARPGRGAQAHRRGRSARSGRCSPVAQCAGVRLRASAREAGSRLAGQAGARGDARPGRPRRAACAAGRRQRRAVDDLLRRLTADGIRRPAPDAAGTSWCSW